MMKRTVSLRRSLTLYFVVAAALPILLLGVLGVQYFERKHIETMTHLLQAHALDVSHEATEFLQYSTASLSIVEKTLESGLFHSDAEINQYLQLAIGDLPNFQSLFLLDSNKKVTHLALSETSTGWRNDYLGMDLSGHVIFEGQDHLSGLTWSDTFLATVSAEPSVTLGIPLEKGTLLGTLSLKGLSAELGERLSQVALPFRFSLLDRQGVVIADSRPELLSQRTNLRMHPEVSNALDHHVEVGSQYHEDGSLLESVHVVPKTGWVAYVCLPTLDAMQGVAPLRFLLASVLSVAACFGIVLSVWLSRRMLKPLLLLRDAVGEVARGHYAQILPAALYQELEDLSGSFRGMVDAVEEREQSIMKAQSRYRDLVNSIDGIVWELELSEFRFTFVSDQAERILGYAAQRWLEDKDFWVDHVHSDDQGWALSYCLSETQALRDHDFEYRMIAADGRVVWLKDVVSVTVEDDHPVRLSGVMLDITKRKEAELSLQETSAQLQLLLNRMPLGCIMWDADKRVKLWNPAAEHIFGVRSEDVVGQYLYEFLNPAGGNREVDPVFEKLAMGDYAAHRVSENLTRDGRTITCEWHNTALQSQEGKFTGVISLVQDITQRFAAENALKESEKRFRTVFQTNPDAVLITRLSDGEVINVNDHCEELSGYRREEMIGKSSLEYDLWADSEQRERYYALLRMQGQVENFEMALCLKDGRIRTGLASARPVTLNGEVCALNVIRDITEMKDAEHRLVRSELRFRSLIAAMGEGMLILAFNGEIIHCNAAAERILGVDAKSIVGLMHDELLSEAIREDGSTYVRDELPSVLTMKTGESVTNQVMGLPKGEEGTIWVQTNTHPLGTDRSGKPVAVVISFANVTRLKRIEAELRESEAHLQAMTIQFEGLLEAIPDRIMVLDREMRVVWLNSHGSGPAGGHKIPSKIPCYEMPEVECGSAAGGRAQLCGHCPVKKTFASGLTDTAQVSLADGRTLALRAFPIFGEHDEVVNVIEIVQDMTDELRQQEQSMRTGQLAALGELAAGVAHEINNPINGIINYAQLILNKAEGDSRELELSRRIIRESERIATIVRELLYFSRPEGADSEVISVLDALNEALDLTQNQMNKEGVNLQIEVPADLPMIKSRSHQVQRMFLNLISNARHALTEKYPETDPGKILEIRAGLIQTDDQSYVRITFHDHGTGIPSGILQRVMNPFFTTKAAGVGTGLGLSISHDIVQKHGGTITIASVPGEYAEVVVDLPAIM